MKCQYLRIRPLLLYMLLTLVSSQINAQVTIGSTTPPIEGVLLDLREEPWTNAVTSTRGLLLPRVQLHSGGLLKMGDADTIPDDRLIAHTGLMVYNVKEDLCASYPIYEGVHIWNGKKWTHLGEGKVGYTNEVREYLDQEGNAFKARQFGAAGIWMTENLAVKSFAGDPTPIILHNISSTSIPQYAYPSANPNGWSTPPAIPNKEGLLYNWPAAANRYQAAGDNQEQVPGDIPGPLEIEKLEETSLNAYDGKIQGICPNGWHLPTDREWNQLERELYDYPEKYSYYTASDLPFDPATPKWDRAWETGGDGLRGSATKEGHAIVMKSPCFPPYYEKSMTAGQGGFDGLLVGLVASRSAMTYGDYVYIWSASTQNPVSSWYRYLTSGDAKVYRARTSDYNLFSVRCKKDVVD